MKTQVDMTSFVESIKAQLMKNSELRAAALQGRYALAQVLTDAILSDAIKAASAAWVSMTDQMMDEGKRRRLARMLHAEVWEAIRAAA